MDPDPTLGIPRWDLQGAILIPQELDLIPLGIPQGNRLPALRIPEGDLDLPDRSRVKLLALIKRR